MSLNSKYKTKKNPCIRTGFKLYVLHFLMMVCDLVLRRCNLGKVLFLQQENYNEIYIWCIVCPMKMGNA